MPAKRFSVEQIIAKLREAEKLQGEGLTIPQMCKKLQISDQTFYRWRLKYGALKEDEAQRPEGIGVGERPPEADRGRTGARHLDAEGSGAGKILSPARRREAVAYLRRRYGVSERRACQLLGQHRSTQRYQPVPADFELRLVKRMHELAAKYPRWGYRMIASVLKGEGWNVNRKRVERLWRLEGLRVPPRRSIASGKKAQGLAINAIWNLQATKPNHIWSYDFMGSRLRNGSGFRILNVVDEFTREGLASRVDRSMGAGVVQAALEQLFRERGQPEVMRSDNGREFIATSLVDWLTQQGITAAFIEKGSPQQNAFVERFNGTMRDEVLNGEVFETLLEARVVINDWRRRYNQERPHRGLGMLTPATFAMTWTEGSE